MLKIYEQHMLSFFFLALPFQGLWCHVEFNVTLEDEVDDVEDNGVHVFDLLDDGIWWHLTALDDGN
jgi:hypothetical protein